MMKMAFGTAVLAALFSVLVTGAVSACPFGKTAQTSQQQTATTSDQIPVPADGSKTETKTGG
jgi:hypothetical protein